MQQKLFRKTEDLLVFSGEIRCSNSTADIDPPAAIYKSNLKEMVFPST